MIPLAVAGDFFAGSVLLDIGARLQGTDEMPGTPTEADTAGSRRLPQGAPIGTAAELIGPGSI
jgi:hypothetical protein